MARTLTYLLWFLCLAALMPVQAQVRHCVAPDGTQIFTDRKCEELGASASQPPVSQTRSARYNRRSVCPSSVQDLAYALEKAMQSGDANQIAGLYDWAGMGTSSAYRVMTRLQQTASRPLVRVQASESGLRLEQTLSDGITPASATFGTHRRLGCWWLHL